MNSAAYKANIKLYLSRFETLVRISTLNNEYDINKHSENFLIPFLKLVYGWDLENANILDKNAKSIDLIDKQKKLAIQVTSDNSLEKIKTTLQKFLQSQYKQKINKVSFYFLLPKQKSYSNEAILKVTKKRIKFTIKSNTYDNADIYNTITNLTDVTKLKEIESFLKKEFSDFYLKDDITIKDFEEFKNKYKDCCLNNYTRLNFFGLSIPKKPREVQLYSLFVKPEFELTRVEILAQRSTSELRQISIQYKDAIEYPGIVAPHVAKDIIVSQNSYAHFDKEIYKRFYRSRGTDRTTLQLYNLFDIGSHLALLGNPGAGKSSLVKYSICKIIEQDFETFNNRDIYNYLPYRIELHKYNQFKKQNQGGFLDFIKSNLIDEFQISIKPKILNGIIEKFPSVIFFDGLDEIFDIQERLQVRNDIENFTRQYPLIKSIVTSRYESYEEVDLNKEIFMVLGVKDFNAKQISEYVTRWYSIEEDNEHVRKQEIKDCIDQLKNVDSQLKHNPLLLSLILILYRNEQDLPTSKLEIYESCAQTIIETRDKKEKKLQLNLKITHKISVFSNLAFWQFNNELSSDPVKIDYLTIENFITKYLITRGEFEEQNEAREAAKQFLDYAKLRSIYFENKFTHKTFYEYFAAFYIFSNYYSTPGGFVKFQELLMNNIGLSSWAVILELLICKIDKSQIEFTVMDSIIDFLLDQKPYETCQLFASVMPHLRTISPSKTKSLMLMIGRNVCSSTKEQDQKFVLVEKLIDLIKIKKYREVFCLVIENEFKKGSVDSRALFVLIFELHAVTKHQELKELVENYNHFNEGNEAKAFIVSKIEFLNDKQQALTLLREFTKKFGKKAVLTTYASKYHLPIFKRDSLFNWIATILINSPSKIEVAYLDRMLLDLGFDSSDVPAFQELNVSEFRFFKELVFSVSYDEWFKDTLFFREIGKKSFDFIKVVSYKTSAT